MLFRKIAPIICFWQINEEKSIVIYLINKCSWSFNAITQLIKQTSPNYQILTSQLKRTKLLQLKRERKEKKNLNSTQSMRSIIHSQ